MLKVNITIEMSSTGLDQFRQGDNWKAYTEQLNSFITLKDIPKEKQKLLLITQLSTPIYEILCSLCAPASPQDSKFSYNDLVKKLEDHLHSQGKYAARLEYKRECQGEEEIIKKYKFEEQLTKGVKSEAMCFKVFRGAGSVKDLIKIATEVEWAEKQSLEKRSHSDGTTNKKTGLFVSQIRRTQQTSRKKIFERQMRHKTQAEKHEDTGLSTKLCYCCGKH